MRDMIGALLLACASSQASALSCAQPRIEQSFNWWVDAPDKYYIGVGTLTAAGPIPDVPSVGALSIEGGNRPDLSAEFRFEGYLLNGEDNYPVDTMITVEVGCAGPWCGGFPATGQSGLMPLKVENHFDLSLQLGACPGTIFDASVEPTVRACMRDGRCPEG